jgi:hypothetical protein
VKCVGHTYVPVDYVTQHGYKLGAWVADLRSTYRRGKLSQFQTWWLEQLPEWVWDESEAKWRAGLKYLREYIDKAGHMNIYDGYVTEDGYRLGIWIRYQRRLYLRGKLSKERQKALEKVPGWTWSPKKDD